MQSRVSTRSTLGSKNGIATRSGKVAGRREKARSEPINTEEKAAAQNDAESASVSSPWTSSRLKKYRYSAPAMTRSQMAKSEYRTRRPMKVGKRDPRSNEERAAVKFTAVIEWPPPLRPL